MERRQKKKINEVKVLVENKALTSPSAKKRGGTYEVLGIETWAAFNCNLPMGYLVGADTMIAPCAL